MLKINLVKALKQKNRLAGEIKKVREIIQRENSRTMPTESKVDVNCELYKMTNLTADIINLKTKISCANIGIYAKIAEMAELKSLIEFYRGLNTRHGDFRVRCGGEIEIERFVATIKQEDVDAITTETQVKINKLQDEIDEYNASTLIEWM